MAFNTHQWYLNGLRKGEAANTFIGGVASVINTPALLAAKLKNYPSGTAFPSYNIQNFKIVGNDIECYIGVDYKIDISYAFAAMPLNKYIDNDNHLKEFGITTFESCPLPYLELNGLLTISGHSSFNAAPLVKHLIFPNLINISNGGLRANNLMPGKVMYIPNCTNLGTSNLDNTVFLNTAKDSYIYAHPSLATNNAGAPDGDLASAISAGATIIYVTNFTAPNTITNLTIGTVYATALQLNFTAPTGSTNAIDFYEVWVNGRYNNTISSSGGYVTGLTPNTVYNIELKPVDIFYNKSTSNIVTQATSNGAITNLSIGTVYATALQVLFTPPTDIYAPNGKYRCYADGVYKNTTVLNGYITGLTPNTSYNITVIAEDGINGVGGSTSNIVTQATIATYIIPTSDLVSYYKMENNVLDSWGSNHGTPTDITYASGLVGQAAVSNGTTSQIRLGMLPNLIYDSSIVFMIKQTSRPIRCNPFEYGSYTSWGSLNLFQDGTLNFYHTPFSGGSSLNPSTAPNIIPLNVWTMVTLVRDYSNGFIRIYFDTNLVMNFATTETRAKDPSSEALLLKGYAGTLNGMQDEIMAFSKALTAGEVSEIYAKLNSGQSLI
ncbi:MAG: hypothetical protein WAW57_15395 [Lutibacter sp.]